MSRILSYIFAIALAVLMLAGSSLATPVPGKELEKRVTRVGRVCLGNCGRVHKSSDPVVAMGKAFYDRNKGGNCGQWIEIVDTATGRKVYGQMWDSCPGCSDNDLGVVRISWHFMNKNWSP
ncbi:hypothetical protein FA15DRAFT_687939 [Coprinopsis marcescibilis]|uniref:RlpA-like protein double-psi beta-barrel domain-containing protein n=1 Tax=Coprinopsis marcescibilis TaxID=230819 RepID=A0A5C3KRY4_COPMA|nr:hypothetical protein FA15DRAFT_687939 [Coprinopsis marcescibilis]